MPVENPAAAVEDIAYEVWAAEIDRGNFSLDAIQGVTDYLGVALFPVRARGAPAQ